VSLCFGWTHKRLNAGLCINNYTLFLCMCLWHFHEPSVFADCHCHLLDLIWLLAYVTPSPVFLFQSVFKNFIFFIFLFLINIFNIIKTNFKKIILIHFQMKNTFKNNCYCILKHFLNLLCMLRDVFFFFHDFACASCISLCTSYY